jgi:hypothetical protein
MDGIHNDVASSDMSNKNIQYCNWSEASQELKITWDVELSAGDKTKLDDIVSNNDEIPVFNTKIEIIFEEDTPPSDKTMTWLNTNDNLRYIWDDDRSKWRTLYRMTYIFAFDGDADNEYLKIMTVYGSTTAYQMPKNAVITGVSCRASGGNNSKGFKIQSGDVELSSFSLSSLVYENMSSNINLTAGDQLKVHCEGDDGAVSNPIVVLEVAWRQ